MENNFAANAPKKRDYGKVGGALIVLFCLFLLFGHIPTNYYSSYKRVQTYKTRLFECGSTLPTEDKKVLENKICSCVYVGRDYQDDDIKSIRKVQKQYYDAMREKYNLSGVFLECEYRDARNDAALRQMGDPYR